MENLKNVKTIFAWPRSIQTWQKRSFKFRETVSLRSVKYLPFGHGVFLFRSILLAMEQLVNIHGISILSNFSHVYLGLFKTVIFGHRKIVGNKFILYILDAWGHHHVLVIIFSLFLTRLIFFLCVFSEAQGYFFNNWAKNIILIPGKICGSCLMRFCKYLGNIL
jgi:hypothetical protein